MEEYQDVINEYAGREYVTLFAKMCAVAIDSEYFSEDEKIEVAKMLKIELIISPMERGKV